MFFFAFHFGAGTKTSSQAGTLLFALSERSLRRVLQRELNHLRSASAASNTLSAVKSGNSDQIQTGRSELERKEQNKMPFKGCCVQGCFRVVEGLCTGLWKGCVQGCFSSAVSAVSAVIRADQMTAAAAG